MLDLLVALHSPTPFAAARATEGAFSKVSVTRTSVPRSNARKCGHLTSWPNPQPTIPIQSARTCLSLASALDDA